MPMYNLLEYGDNYLKTSESLWQFYRVEKIMNNDGVIVNVPDEPDNASFKYEKITGHWWRKKCSNNGIVKIFK